MKLQVSPKRKQIKCVYRLKKFIDPANSKFLNQERRQKESSDGEENELKVDRNRKDNKMHKEQKLSEYIFIKAEI